MRARQSGYWVDEQNWSWYMSFLMMSGGTLFLALPITHRVAAANESTLSIESVFPTVFAVLLGIFGLNLGQAEAQRRAQFGRETRAYALHMMAQLSLLLFSSLPFWLAIQAVTSVGALQLTWGLLHLFVYGFCLALLGLRIALISHSEIYQFNVKYLFLAVYLLGTLFVGKFINPLLALSLILESRDLRPFSVFFVYSYLSFGLAVTALLFWIGKQLARGSEEA